MAQNQEKKHIIDDDDVYCYVHKSNISKTGKPRAAAFQNTPREGDNLSCDWRAYTTPEDTKARIGKQFRTGTTEFKNPDIFGISQFKVKHLRVLELGQKVEHDPIFSEPEILGQPNNYAHSIIIGEKDEETRLKMVELSEWIIMPL